MKLHSIVALGCVALAAACTPPAKKEEAVDVAAAAESTCPDDGPRFAGTGLCVGRAVNYLDPETLMTSEVLPEGCTWSVNETMMGSADEALLYQAVTCEGKTTQLEMRAGARSGSLGYVTSAYYDPVPADFEPVKIFTTDGQADPKAMILEMAKATTEDPKEAAACEIRPLNPPGSVMADAFVVDVSDAYKAANKLPEDEIYAACGPWGVADSQSWWVIRQGYAWFVDFGQDNPDFNPNSLTRMQKDADGNWNAMP